jgi:hypothetical protein
VEAVEVILDQVQQVVEMVLTLDLQMQRQQLQIRAVVEVLETVVPQDLQVHQE